MENIRDFIILHYISPRRDTKFWKDVSEIELPDSLKNNLSMWKHRLPVADDFKNKTLFNEFNHALVLHGMDIFDRDSLKKQYKDLHIDAKRFVDDVIKQKEDFDGVKAIPHKMMLDLLRRLS